MSHNSKTIVRVLALALMIVAVSFPVSAQEQQTKQLVYLTSEGDIFRATTPSPARIHLHGDLTVASADFFRGQFRGVQEDLDDWAIKPTLAMTLELFRNWNVVRELNLTAGMETGFSDTDPFPRGELDSFNWWYMANPYVGVSMRLVGGILAGVTYTYYDSPNNALRAFDEFAFTAKYVGADTLGRVNLQGKIAFPTDTDDGVYFEVSARPAFQLAVRESPITISFPLILGIGVDDYYGNENVETYLTAGVIGSVPLPVDPSQFGDWRVNLGIDFTFRDDALRDINQYDDGGSTVTRAILGLSFMY
jgi:hypothetical protein